MSAVKRTGGVWNPKGPPIYFMASAPSMSEVTRNSSESILTALNEINGEGDELIIQDLCANGFTVFLDSGVFWLSTQHAKANNVSMDQALALAPADIDNFDDLLEQYLDVMARIGEKSWGYIEIDQGGRENKIKTRAMLESHGLRPIPVYHPLNDGWEYFDELASQYDRICLGNVVQADAQTRKRIIATVFERRAKDYPDLWVHVLGLTCNEWMVAYPLSSCDSSTWLSAARWGMHSSQASCRRFSPVHDEFIYDRESDKDSARGHSKAWQFCAYEAHLMQATWRAVMSEQQRVFGGK